MKKQFDHEGATKQSPIIGDSRIERTVSRPKVPLTCSWIVSVITFVLTAPVAFIVFCFSGDNNSPNRDVQTPLLYLASPLIFLVLPIVAQITYLCRLYRAAKWIAIGAITLCGLAAGICVLELTAPPRFGAPIGLAASADRTFAQSALYTFTTLADTAGIGSTDGTGSAAEFHYPTGVAVDGAGNVYVADTYIETIRKVTPAGEIMTLAGLAGSWGSADGTGSAARFHQPDGVAVDSAGNVYVADRVNSTIRKVTPAGVVTTLAGLAGSYGSKDGTGSAAEFFFPTGIAVDSAGVVYVADSHNNTIRKVTPAGVVTMLAGLAGVNGTNVGKGSTDGTGSAALFDNPTGVAVDSAGNVYVADSNNNTIRKVTPTGVVTTLAGLACRSGSADGTGSAARFSYPTGIAVDSVGNIYVGDNQNNTIRKVTAAGVVTTLRRGGK